MQLFDSLLRMLAQLIEFAKVDGFGRTRLGAGRKEILLQTVIAERTLPSAAILFSTVNDPKRAVHDAIPAAVADIRLYVHGFEFGSDDRASGTTFETTCPCAMFTNVRREQPGEGALLVGMQGHRSFDESDVPPGGSTKMDGVVVGHSGKQESIFRQLVPLLAGHFACLTADAKRRIGKEALPAAHVQTFPSLVSIAL